MSKDTSSSAPPQENSADFNALNEGGEIDYQELFEKTNQDLSATKDELSKTQKDLGAVKSSTQETSAKFDRIKAALMGDEAKASEDPLTSALAALDEEENEHLQLAMQAEKAGKAIPVTINNALKRIEFQREMLKENASLKAKLGEIDGRLKQVADPANTIDQMAFSNMDNQIVSAIETMYGPSEEYQDIKSAQFQAVSQLVVKEIKTLKKDDPTTWDRIRRDKGAQTKLVNHFIKQTIPPKARQLMDDDHIKRTPMSLGETYAAWNEAKELLTQTKDPKGREQAKKYVTELRQQLLSMTLDKNMGKRGAISQLYRGE